MAGLIGKKIGMTQVFTGEGSLGFIVFEIHLLQIVEMGENFHLIHPLGGFFLINLKRHILN